MSAFAAKLSCTAGTFDIRTMDVKFYRDTDDQGLVSSVPKGGKYTLECVSTDESPAILGGMINNLHKTDSYKITVKKPNEDSSMIEIQLKDGYVVEYDEHFDIGTTEPMSFRIAISAIEVTHGSASFSNSWAGFN